MCGRTALTTSPEDLRDAFDLAKVPDFAPRYNVVPSQPVAVIRSEGSLELLRWGLVPFWAKDPSIGHKLALARAETAETTPAFRDAIRQRRCVVVVSGFYEWKRAGKKGSRPYFARRADAKPFALAGVWDRWVSKDGEVIESCAILTQPARPPLDAVHDRMPVLLGGDAWRRWLRAPAEGDVGLGDAGGASLVTFPVDPYVNDPRHDDARCLEPAAEPEQRDLFE
jgi:putative SOS response-associated peptidase YedK